MIRRPGVAGFTLIELLMAITLTSLISFSVYSLFSSSVNVMRRMSETNVDEDLNVCFEKIERDVENLVRYKPIPFTGTSQEFNFAFPLSSASDQASHQTFGRLSIFYDASTDTLKRRFKNMSDLHENELGKPSILLNQVSHAQFSYLVFVKDEQQYSWFDEYAEDQIPNAVKIEMGFRNGPKTTELKRTFFLPLGE